MAVPLLASILLLLLIPTALTQSPSNGYPYNLTLTFSAPTALTNPQDDPVCPSLSIPGSITITTRHQPISQPQAGNCFNLASLLPNNSTLHPINTSSPVLGVGRSEPIFHVLSAGGTQPFDPRANYSHVLYTQRSPDNFAQGANETDSRFYAPRTVNFYREQDCPGVYAQGYESTVAAEEAMDPAPWYQTSCRAEAGCHVFPWSVGSLYVWAAMPMFDEDDHRSERDGGKGHCVMAAPLGNGAARIWGRGEVLIGWGLVGLGVLEALRWY